MIITLCFDYYDEKSGMIVKRILLFQGNIARRYGQHNNLFNYYTTVLHWCFQRAMCYSKFFMNKYFLQVLQTWTLFLQMKMSHFIKKGFSSKIKIVFYLKTCCFPMQCKPSVSVMYCNFVEYFVSQDRVYFHSETNFAAAELNLF